MTCATSISGERLFYHFLNVRYDKQMSPTKIESWKRNERFFAEVVL